MAAVATIESTAQSLVRRARAGDQNAMALIQRVGVAARARLNARAMRTYEAIDAYINSHPIEKARKSGISRFGFGRFASLFGAEPSAPKQLPAAPVKPLEDVKPILPHGALDGIFDPKQFEVCVARACGYRHGLPAAAIVLASGPELTVEGVKALGANLYAPRDEDDGRLELFLDGVRRCADADWRGLAAQLDPESRRTFVCGQCVGRARDLQLVRRDKSLIGRFSSVAGWELGE